VRSTRLRSLLSAAFVAALGVGLAAQQMTPTQPRGNQGEGPFDRLVIRGVTMIDGTGAQPRGPMDIVVEQNRIIEVASVGFPQVAIDPERRPTKGTKEIDGTGPVPDARLRRPSRALWRRAGQHPRLRLQAVDDARRHHRARRAVRRMDWDLGQRDLSARRTRSSRRASSRITARSRARAGTRSKPQTPDTAREWVRWAKANKGIDGLKLTGYDPEIMAALLDEAKKHNLGSTAHIDQMGVVRMTARDASRLGLGAMTHYYGLFESLLKDSSIQQYPVNQNYNDEQHRFGQVARLWDKIHPRGSEPWNALIKEWVDRKFIIDPTMTIYSAGRDVMRMRNADWHEKYTHPVALGVLPAEPRRARRLLVRLDDRGRGGVEEVLPGVDELPERLQERRRPRHDRLGFGLHLPDLRLRLHPRARDAAGSRVPPARGHPLGHAARRRGAARAQGQATSSSASSGRACWPTWCSSTRTRSQNFKTLYGTGACA
jgi:hypothetical protein